MTPFPDNIPIPDQRAVSPGVDQSLTPEEIKRQNPLTGYLESIGARLVGTGPALTTNVCPLVRHKKNHLCVSVDVEKQLWHCNDCSTGGDIITWISLEKGITAGEVLKQLGGGSRAPRRQQGKAAGQSEIECTYDYRNELDEIVYQVVRMIPKTFRQRHMIDGSWIWSMEGVTRVLYRLPEVLKSETVWICEGERDADNLAKLGFTATTNVGGAEKWLDAYTESLTGKDIILCGDNDEPGRKHIDLVFESLSAKVTSTRVVVIPGPSKDVSDFIATLKTSEEAKAALNKLVLDSTRFFKGIRVPVFSVGELQAGYRAHIADLGKSSLDLGKWLPSLGRQVRSLVPGDMVLVLGDTGIGKCLGKGTPVIRYDGTTDAVENIRPGDFLMGPDSCPRFVKSTCVGSEIMYRVTQKNGDSYECNGSHILSLQTTSNPCRKLTPNQIINISVSDYISKSRGWRHVHKGYKVGLEFSSQPLPIDPYFLGLWLGDGNSDDAAITTGDKEIEDYLHRFSKSHKLSLRRIKGAGCNTVHLVRLKKWKRKCSYPRCESPMKCGGYCGKHYHYFRYHDGFSAQSDCGTDIRGILRSIGVFNNKHIPQMFKSNRRSNRLSLLAGLLDSDGFSSEYGTCFCNTNEVLAKDVLWIARSLGFRASIIQKKTSIKSTGYKGTAWVVLISGNISDIPVLLNRKLGKDKTKYSSNRYGIKVEPIGVGDYYGFEIDGDGRFILGDFTVTHNTAMLSNIAISSRPTPTVFFEMELPPETMFERFIALKTKMPASDVEAAYVKGEAVAQEKELDMLFPGLFICTECGLSAEQLEGHIVKSQLKIGENPKLVLLDYIQLMQGFGKRYEKASDNAEKLKIIAKRCGVIVIVASQVSRPGENEDREINLHSGKDSGSLENSSGLVIGAWRDAEDRNLMYVKVLKNTKGMAWSKAVECNYNGAVGLITERSLISDEDIPQTRSSSEPQETQQDMQV